MGNLFTTEVSRTRIKEGEFVALDSVTGKFYLTMHPILNSECIFQPPENFLKEEKWNKVCWDIRIKQLTLDHFELVHYDIVMEETAVYNFPLY